MNTTDSTNNITNSKASTLVMFMEIPDGYAYYQTNDQDLIAKLQHCHNQFVNHVHCPEDISDLISDIFYGGDGDVVDPRLTKLGDDTDGGTPPVNGNWNEMIITGMLL